MSRPAHDGSKAIGETIGRHRAGAQQLAANRSIARPLTRRLPSLSRVWLVLSGCAFMALAGCHSAFVQATIDNQSSSDLKLVEVDYPSASFGVETLAAHDKYHYRFKVQGSGQVKLQFADNSGKLITSAGPQLEEGQEGKLNIIIDANRQVTWTPALHVAR